ncbi:MAG TPA: response regulator [Bacteroidia bacterium]|nr:response regulator [Bacteroidia bacterium]
MLKIFYVDDDADNLDLFSIAVKEFGEAELVKCTLHMYSEGDALMAALKQNKPVDALIFVDINMPKKNGFDILKEIKLDTHLSSLPVIMFSNASDNRSITVSQELGASLYAVKPTSITGIVNLIKKVSTIKWHQANLSNIEFLINAL